MWADCLSPSHLCSHSRHPSSPPFVLQSVLKHCREVLTNKHNVTVEDMSDWYGDPDTGVPETKTAAKSGGVKAVLRF